MNTSPAIYDDKTLTHLRSAGRWARTSATVTPNSQNWLHNCQPSLFVGSPSPAFSSGPTRESQIALQTEMPHFCPVPTTSSQHIHEGPLFPSSPLPWQPLCVCQVIMADPFTVASSVHLRVYFFFSFYFHTFFGLLTFAFPFSLPRSLFLLAFLVWVLCIHLLSVRLAVMNNNNNSNNYYEDDS